jgi:DNA helicase-2/ATP-dependent DNA helicase PcrA
MLEMDDTFSFLRICNEPRRGIGPKRKDLIKNYSNMHACSYVESFCRLIESRNELLNNKDSLKFYDFIKTYKQKNDFITTKVGANGINQASNILTYVLDKSGYEEHLRNTGEDERLDNLAELKQSLSEFEKVYEDDGYTIADYLQRVTLLTGQDVDDSFEKVYMMTIHAAKGLEFPYVFIPGLNENIFPSSKVKTRAELEEERRLAYVAFTRAMDGLFLSDAEGMTANGGFRLPSRFIFDTERVGVDYVVELDKGLVAEAKLKISSGEFGFDMHTASAKKSATIKTGSAVIHDIFGGGVVVKIDEKYPQIIEVLFNETGATKEIQIGFLTAADKDFA